MGDSTAVVKYNFVILLLPANSKVLIKSGTFTVIRPTVTTCAVPREAMNAVQRLLLYVDKIVITLNDAELKAKSHFLFTPCVDAKLVRCGTPSGNVAFCHELAEKVYMFVASLEKSALPQTPHSLFVQLTEMQSPFVETIRDDYPQFVWSVVTTIDPPALSGQVYEPAYQWHRKRQGNDKIDLMWIEEQETIVPGSVWRRKKSHWRRVISRGLQYGQLTCCLISDSHKVQTTIWWTCEENINDNAKVVPELSMNTLRLDHLIRPEKYEHAVAKGLKFNELEAVLSNAQEEGTGAVPLVFLQQIILQVRLNGRSVVRTDLAINDDGVPFPRIHPKEFFDNNVRPSHVYGVLFWPFHSE